MLPKQTDLNKILKIIGSILLKGPHFHMPLKETQAGYLTSLYFKNIYLYIAQNKLLSPEVAVRQVDTQTNKYLLLDSLLFWI